MGCNKGHKRTEEHKKKYSISKLGNKNPMFGKKPWNYGLTKETSESVKIGTDKMTIKKKLNPCKPWLGKKRPDMKFVPGWNHTGEKQSQENIDKRKQWTKTEKGKDILRQNAINTLYKFKKSKISKAELKVKEFLDNNKIKYEQQWRYKYGVADFFIPSKNLVLECYGKYWHTKPDYVKRDIIKNKYLFDNGYNVLIIWSEDIMDNKIDLNGLIV